MIRSPVTWTTSLTDRRPEPTRAGTSPRTDSQPMKLMIDNLSSCLPRSQMLVGERSRLKPDIGFTRLKLGFSVLVVGANPT